MRRVQQEVQPEYAKSGTECAGMLVLRRVGMDLQKAVLAVSGGQVQCMLFVL